MIEEFCNIVENSNGYFCQSVDLIGKIPPQFEFLYVITFMIYFLMVVLVIISPILILIKVSGGISE